MTKKLLLLLVAVTLGIFLAGCVSSNYADFISKVPAVSATDITQTTSTPVYSHQESASGISTDPTTGIMTIVNGKAAVGLPLLGTTWTLSISGLKIQATPAQLSAATSTAGVVKPTPPPGN